MRKRDAHGDVWFCSLLYSSTETRSVLMQTSERLMRFVNMRNNDAYGPKWRRQRNHIWCRHLCVCVCAAFIRLILTFYANARERITLVCIHMMTLAKI